MEFLVHNISHSDLVVELTGDVALKSDKNTLCLLARPKFSLFNIVSQCLVKQLELILPLESTLEFDVHEYCTETSHPVGFRFGAKAMELKTMTLSLSDFQLRCSEETQLEVEKVWTTISISAVFLPLLACLVPKWQQVLVDVNSQESQQLLYLISGAGIPRNATHPIVGNSTEFTGALMTQFIHTYYPKIQITRVHSGSNIFRYDDNVQFMTRELRPLLEAHRDTLVQKVGDTWKSHFHLTISYADGPPARLSALNAALRVYTPSYLHLWQLKTFWHESKLSLGDVDFHPFEDIEATPAIALSDIKEPFLLRLVSEMKAFRDCFLEGQHLGEVGSFWLRKSRKPVLAILLIQKKLPNGDITTVVHRGMNCEVSMPTGSLCAERNAIGSALASDPTLHRNALKMIGVLSVNLAPPSPPQTELMPPQITPSVHSNGSDSSSPKSKKPKRPRTFSCDGTTPAVALALDSISNPKKEAVDRNPLGPCGACNEWLLKIAEANPSFKIITFGSMECDSIYVHQLL
ncbi:hypothetical protein THRCLA_06551 [Thraustotheca clavata]|uniref:Uncharacterized protein n=1 Tax=Thraustotheca clavata TaxID=74557 RepID=A0A1V9ZMX0_9STRA|nr:hypothetical protein THRCLA_06551 [Thraustotheca clavata]